MIRIIFCCFFILTSIQAQETKEPLQKTDVPTLPPETTKEVLHEVKIGGRKIPYKATTGTQHVKDEKGCVCGTLFFTAYTRTDITDTTRRPLTFCFNGGPGSSSAWLHLGFLGPKRVETDSFGHPLTPFRLKDNDLSLLDVTDLVFIDPISTGYSRATENADLKKQFHNWEGDIKTINNFIRLYTTRYDRWLSPKFLTGESYGATRAAAMALSLMEEHDLHLNGIVLISPPLEYQTLRLHQGNDLPFLTYLPSYSAVAWYHQKLSTPLLKKTLPELLEEVEQFVISDYQISLFLGDDQPKEKMKSINQRLSEYTSLPSEFIVKANYRIPGPYFSKELLREEKKVIGRFDARFTGYEVDPFFPYSEYDPCEQEILSPFAACYNAYVRNDLGWITDEEYRIIAEVFPWDFQADNKYLVVSSDLREALIKNKQLTVFAACGYFDLAVPYFGVKYTLNHLDLPFDPKEKISCKFYEAGHMIYLHQPSLIKLREDLLDYYQKALSDWK